MLSRAGATWVEPLFWGGPRTARVQIAFVAGPLSDLGDLQGWNLEAAVQPSSVSWDSDLASSAEKEKWSETTTSEEGGG